MKTNYTQFGSRILELDGLRALAVLAVIADHFFVVTLQTSGPLTDFAFRLGSAGVQYFFVLSGFVISRALLEEHAANGRISLRKFWLRRCFRILPAYWVFLLVVTLLGCSHLIRTDLHSLLWSAFLITNVVQVDWFHGHTWSLSVEEQFYLVGPLVAFVFLRGRRLWVGLVGSSIYLVCVFWSRSQRELAALHLSLSLSFLSNFRFICAGVMLGFFHRDIDRFLRRAHGGIMAAAALTMLALREPLTSYGGRLAYESTLPLGIACVIGWVALAGDRCAWLRWTSFQWTGRCSYSLYLWQQLFLGPPLLYGLAMSRIPSVALLALVFAFGAASFRYVEKPAIAWGRGLCAVDPKRPI